VGSGAPILAGVNIQRLLILAMAVAAGLAAAYFVAFRVAPRDGGQAGDDYCYELRQAWVCTYARPECEARLAREAPADVKTRCTAHAVDTLSP
jgi:hypothetical protein